MTPMEGQEYFKPGRPGTWADNADQLYNQQHAIDPSTGAITGPLGAIPAGVAQNWQAAHEQAVFNARQNWMSAGITAQQSALGALQSFRPGGLAALESNVYGNLGNAYFQRAAQTEPMNLMGDYVRDASARAQQKANRAGEFRTVAGLALGAASIAAPIVGGALAGGGAPAAAGAATPGGATSTIGGPTAGQGMSVPGGGGALGAAISAGGNLAGGIAAGLLTQPGQTPGGAAVTGPQQGGQQAPGAGPFSSLGGQVGAGGAVMMPGNFAGFPPGISAPGGAIGTPLGGGPAPGGGQTRQAQGGASGPAGGPGPSGGPSGGAPGGGGGPGGGAAGGGGGAAMGPGGRPRVGANGDFTPLSYSMAAAANPSPTMDAIQTVVARDLAKIIDADPDWQFMDALFSKQVQARKNYGIFRGQGYGDEASSRMAAYAGAGR